MVYIHYESFNNKGAMMQGGNVKQEQIELYVKIFNKTLEDRAKNLNPEIKDALKHLKLLPAKIICYISTQFGVAMEYIPAEKTSVETVVGSARIEDLILKAPKKLSESAPFLGIGARCFGLEGTSTVGSFPFRLTKKDAFVTISKSDFKAPAFKWNRYIDYAEVYGERASSEWTEEMAIERANVEVDTAMFEFNRAETLRMSREDYLKSAGEKLVVVLGSYDNEGLQRLEKMKTRLVQLGYDAILPKDYELDISISRKVLALSSLARFIVFDDTTKSGHIRELEMCKNSEFIMALLRENGLPCSQMTVDYTVGTTIRKEFAYTLPTISNSIDEAVVWAEQTKVDTDQERKLKTSTM